MGINSILKADDISIYPNPSKGKITINIGKAGSFNLKIFNETGQLVMEKTVKGNQVNVLNISAAKGNYIVEIDDIDGSKVIKKIMAE